MRSWLRPRKPQFEARDDGLAMVDIGEQPHHLDRIRKGYRVLVEDAKPGSPDIAELKAIAAVLL